MLHVFAIQKQILNYYTRNMHVYYFLKFKRFGIFSNCFQKLFENCFLIFYKIKKKFVLKLK